MQSVSTEPSIILWFDSKNNNYLIRPKRIENQENKKNIISFAHRIIHAVPCYICQYVYKPFDRYFLIITIDIVYTIVSIQIDCSEHDNSHFIDHKATIENHSQSTISCRTFPSEVTAVQFSVSVFSSFFLC